MTKRNKKSFYEKYGKRCFDYTLSMLALILLSPVLALIALLVRIKHGSPILFTPTRPGMNEEIFHLYKFRTMSNAKDKDGILLPEKDRLTKFGKFLRSSSLDELPELINIVKGDMSIVGPRPLPMKYLPYYSEKQRERHSVRPGLTGLAQISGRNNLPWNERFDIDIEYVRNLSLINDIHIVLKTVAKVFKGADVVVPGNTTFYQFDTYKVLENEGLFNSHNTATTWGEIGGDYWLDESEVQNVTKENELLFPCVDDKTFTVSGRAAIDLALTDILQNREIKKVWIPSYCSFGMLQPFIQRDIEYKFYNVKFGRKDIIYDINDADRDDVVLVMSYFGLDRNSVNSCVKKLKNSGCIVIEDITHSFLSEPKCCAFSDYYILSLRKWFAIPTGGMLGKRTGILYSHPDLDGELIAQKPFMAMKEKREYIKGESNTKEGFLIKFSSFESDLVQSSSMLKIDSYSFNHIMSVDILNIVRRRKENALALIRGLASLKEISVLLNENDINIITPLYVPVLVSELDRDQLQDVLKENGVFCPITWPERMGARLGIRKKELSLICDQRYDIRDMEYIVDIIKRYFEYSKSNN